MDFLHYLRARNWPTLLGYVLFIGMMSVGYYYNVTFVQLGLKDLGERILGLERTTVAAQMALLALITCVVALMTGWWMQRRGWGRSLPVKLRLAFGVVVLQTLLTVATPWILNSTLFLLWIVLTSVSLGVGVPAMFSMTVDLIPVRDRGYVAAVITALSYLAAAALANDWTVGTFTRQMLLIMPPGALLVGLLAFKRFDFMDQLAQQHRQPRFAHGRFVRATDEATRPSRRLMAFILFMFAVYFVDSLGFLRLVDTPIFMSGTWQSQALGARMFIGLAHVVAAAIAGILYAALSERSLLMWSLGIFALTHFMTMFQARLLPDNDATLGMPLLYATAVSLYTVLNFAVWADLSTPRTISLNSALGVALSGWTATFISTALAIQWQAGGMPLERHLALVDAAAMIFFVFMLVLSLCPVGGFRPGPLLREVET
ncbi:MAG: hypothetical protein R3300_03815 [Candidatus Promineifilaceae bacterium]|nr:hypothetical protein [Candidatus Promineifilaceae bacterium]